MRWVLILPILLIVACTQGIEEIKTEESIGKTVTLSGTVENTIKIGKLSGFTLSDGEHKIGISTTTLPEEGTTVTVKGVLIKDSLFGYYVKAESIR